MKNLAMERNPNWKGGRRVGSDGYAYLKMPGHPRASSNGYVREHIVVAERALGKPLPATHPIHHVDEDKARNVGGNLVICESKAYHLLLHQRTRALLACGNPDALRCSYCHRYDRQEDMHIRIGPSDGRYGYHRNCENAARRRRYSVRAG